MRRHGHDRAGAIGHHDIVGDPDGNARAIDGIDGIRANEHAGLFLVCRRALDLALPCRLVLVCRHGIPALIRRQLVDQRVLGGQHHKRRSPQGVGPGGKDLERIPGFRPERHLRAFAAPDPVLLHGLDPLGPLDLSIVEQLVGIRGGLEKPLVQLFFDHGRIAALAVAVVAPHLLAGQRRITARAEIDRRKLAIDKAHLVHFHKEPLGPAIVAGQAGHSLAPPVKHRSHGPELLAHVLDVLDRPFVGMDAALAGCVLSRQAKGIKAHRKEHIVPVHAQIACPRIRRRHGIPVPNVQVPTGIGQHGHRIVLFLSRIDVRVIQLVLVPFFLPLWFDRGRIVLFCHDPLPGPYDQLGLDRRDPQALHGKIPFASGTKGTLRGTTLVEADRVHPLPLDAGNGGCRRRLHHNGLNDAVPRRVRPCTALLDGALPRFHRNAALYEDGLLVLFITFTDAPRPCSLRLSGQHAPLPETRIAYESTRPHRRPQIVVELRGLEPLTLSMPLRCAPSCATAP